MKKVKQVLLEKLLQWNSMCEFILTSESAELLLWKVK